MVLSDEFVRLFSEQHLPGYILYQKPLSIWIEKAFGDDPEDQFIWNIDGSLTSKNMKIPISAMLGSYSYLDNSFRWGLPDHPAYEHHAEMGAKIDTTIVEEFYKKYQKQRIPEFLDTGFGDVEPKIMDMIGEIAANQYKTGFYKFGVQPEGQHRIDYLLLLNTKPFTKDINYPRSCSVNDIVECIDQSCNYFYYYVNYTLVLKSIVKKTRGTITLTKKTLLYQDQPSAPGEHTFDLEDSTGVVSYLLDSEGNLLKRTHTIAESAEDK